MNLWFWTTMRDAAYLRHEFLVRCTTPAADWEEESRNHRKIVDAAYRPILRACR